MVSTASSLLPRLKDLCNAHPALAVELVATAGIFNLARREADIAISLAMPQQGRLVGTPAHRLHALSLRYGGASKYRASIKTIDDLSRHWFIGYIEDLLFSLPN